MAEMTDRELLLSGADAVIDAMHSGRQILRKTDVEMMIEALGGDMRAIEICDHGPSICIYISALMVRAEIGNSMAGEK